jgi:hypothetical protein
MSLKHKIIFITLLITCFLLISFSGCYSNFKNRLVFPNDSYYNGTFFIGMTNSHRINGYIINCDEYLEFNISNEEYNTYHYGYIEPVDGEFDSYREEVNMDFNIVVNTIPRGISYDLNFEYKVDVDDKYKKLVMASDSVFFFDDFDEEKSITWNPDMDPEGLEGIVAMPRGYNYSFKIIDQYETVYQSEEIELTKYYEDLTNEYIMRAELPIDDTIPEGDYELKIYPSSSNQQNENHQLTKYNLTILYID